MILVGTEAEKFILKEISNHLEGISETLAKYDPIHAVKVWRETLRAVEELINLPGEIEDDELRNGLLSYRLLPTDPLALMQIRQALRDRFDGRVAERFCMTVCQIAAVAVGFKLSGQALDELTDVDGAIRYFQSRRRQMLAVLYALPNECRGMERIGRMDTLNVLLPVIEHSSIALSNSYRHIFLLSAIEDYSIDVGATAYTSNYFFQTLNAAFLEPERGGITEISHRDFDLTLISARPKVDRRKVFSVAELCGELMALEAGYAEFQLASATSFATLPRFIVECARYCRDDYYIELSVGQLNELMTLCNLPIELQRALVDTGTDYRDHINSFAPFVGIGTTRLSTVTWLSRFAYHWAGVCLNRVKRYQVRMGFIFEKQVKEELARQGFDISEIKRIERQEFDVIATKNRVIYNVQCKNNRVDLTLMEFNPKVAASYNRRLEKYYAGALRKEERREHLLRDEFGLSAVKHVVLSKYPIATRNPRILAFREIARFGERFGDRE
ncbi:hypothetical protein [Burkholderia cepacia]|uniref:hypothetical protein n=1 Tax=Burkholderia cepacia TaxID=292 RepID=UPI00398EE0FF